MKRGDKTTKRQKKSRETWKSSENELKLQSREGKMNRGHDGGRCEEIWREYTS